MRVAAAEADSAATNDGEQETIEEESVGAGETVDKGATPEAEPLANWQQWLSLFVDGI